MLDPFTISRQRRPDVDRAYRHLADLVAGIDLSEIDDPVEQWLTAARLHVMPRHGAVGVPIDVEGITYTPVLANGVEAQWVTAENSHHAQRIVYIHGGGWICGTPHDYREISATLARLTGASILMVDYRLAPEHPFPAGLDDCEIAYNWALENGPDTGVATRSGRGQTERVTMAGDSAGANLSVATCLRIAQKGGRLPDRLALIAGVFDNVTPRTLTGVDDPIITVEGMARIITAYVPASVNYRDPFISPVFAQPDLLASFPPTLIQVSSCELLAQDSMAFTDCLKRAGVRVDLNIWPDLPHVWHAFLGLLPEARQALGELAEYLSR